MLHIGNGYGGDDVLNNYDNCPTVNNINQTDSNGDGMGDVCDNCLYIYNPEQLVIDMNDVGQYVLRTL